MSLLGGWALAIGFLACTKGQNEAPAIPPAPNASTAHDVLPGPAPVPPVTGARDFTLVYSHSMDGEIEPCG
jgi:hypothetical protein